MVRLKRQFSILTLMLLLAFAFANFVFVARVAANPDEIVDSYSETNGEGAFQIEALHPSASSYISAAYQCFQTPSTAYKITSAKFYLRKFGNPTGTAYAVLYAMTGTYGSSGKPTGSALATSIGFDVSTLTTSFQLITFTFNSSQQYEMAPNTYYCIAFIGPTSGTVNSLNPIQVAQDPYSPTHSGNAGHYANSAWNYDSGYDLVFYVYGVPANNPPNAPTLNSPSENAWFNPSTSVQFTWTFNDNNTGDSQTAFQLQIGNSGFSTVYVDTGKVASSNTNTTVALPSTVGLYYWRVKTWDSQDAEGSWSSGRAIIVDRNLVGVTTADRATYYPFQRKSFYANERFWLFYSNGTHMVYTVSVDGFTWSDATPVRVATQGYQFSVWFDGTYVHYAYAAATSIYYRRGIPSVDGSIMWSTEEQTVSTTYNRAGWVMISVDSNGYPWIGYIEIADVPTDTRYPFVIKNTWNNGSWLTAAGFPHQLSTTAMVSWTVSPIPLTNGKMAVFYVYTGAKIKVKAWNGSAWGTEAETMSCSLYHDYSAVAQEDDVHLTFNEYSSFRNIYTKYSYATNTFSSETAFPPPYGPGTGYALGEISINPSTNDLYIFSYKHVIKYTASSGTWSSWMLWLPETEYFTSTDRFTCFYKADGGYIGFAYMIKQASPYYMKFYYLTFPSSDSPFIIYPLNSTSIISQVSWDNVVQKLSFTANGNVTVYVGNYGQPLRIEVNSEVYTNWEYLSTEQKVTIYNVDSNVALYWQELPPDGTRRGGTPPTPQPPSELPPVVIPPEAVPLVNIGLVIIVVVVVGAYAYSQITKPKTVKWKRRKRFER